MLTKIETVNNKTRVKQIVKGKLLGLLTDKQYAVISKNPNIRNKIITGEICTLSDVSDILLHDADKVYRLVVNAKFIDGVIKNKHLFITDRLNVLTKCFTDNKTRIVKVQVDDYTTITMTESAEVAI